MTIVPIRDFLKTYGLFLVIDIIYLGFIRGKDMRQYFAKFGGYHPKLWLYGGIAWSLLALGVEYFAVQNTRKMRGSKFNALVKGAILGLVIYGVYDFTNMATIKGWTMNFVIQDVAWGTALCAAIAYIRR